VSEAFAVGGELLLWRKPRRQHCGYVCSTGCSIYKEKPGACTEFECEWLKGNVPEDLKPNECGVIFWTEPFYEMGGPHLVAEEAWPGAENEERFKEVCETMSRVGLLVVYRKGPSRKFMQKGESKIMADLMTDPRFKGAKLVPFERILEEEKELGVR
jgi:hypothetical protein